MHLGLDAASADVIHELAGREGYELRPSESDPPRAPAPGVASKIGAHLTGASWAGGTTANREATYRFVRSLDWQRDRVESLHVVLDPRQVI